MNPNIVITTGEPAGVGPDIVLDLARRECDANLIAIGSKALLAERAKQLGVSVELTTYSSTEAAYHHQPGTLRLIDVPLKAPCAAGRLDPVNSNYVLAQLELAAELCRAGDANAMVTAPVHKGVINESGVPFSGHTEFLAQLFGVSNVVMMLVAGELRIALATTHLPLRSVPDAISSEKLECQIRAIVTALQQDFGLPNPNVTVLGLNPHAGEAGTLGREEIEVITPPLARLQDEGLSLFGPVPADSAFTEEIRGRTDAYLAMYHDQGLPVLKSEGFGEAVNVTLGLPIIRTSVDHGTALDIAGTGKANSSSLAAALQLAIELSEMRSGA